VLPRVRLWDQIVVLVGCHYWRTLASESNLLCLHWHKISHVWNQTQIARVNSRKHRQLRISIHCPAASLHPLSQPIPAHYHDEFWPQVSEIFVATMFRALSKQEAKICRGCVVAGGGPPKQGHGTQRWGKPTNHPQSKRIVLHCGRTRLREWPLSGKLTGQAKTTSSPAPSQICLCQSRR
jgi:hypothetical protein